MPVGVEERKEADADTDLAGAVEPISTPSRAPSGLEAPLTWRQVTTARPRPLVPRSGSIAKAMGFWSTATRPGASVPTGLAVSGVRSMVETVFEPVLVTTATPEVPTAWPVYASLGRTAIPVGVSPVAMVLMV